MIKKHKTTVNLSVPVELADKVYNLAEEQNVTVSSLYCKAVEGFLEAQEDE